MTTAKTSDGTSFATSSSNGPIPSIDEVLQCQFSSWYPLFRDLHNVRIGRRRRKNVTIPSLILSPLPVDFQDFLLSDGVQLPQGATHLSSAMPSSQEDVWSDDDEDNADHLAGGENDDEHDVVDDKKENNDDEGNRHDDSSSPQKSDIFFFPQLSNQIQLAIHELGGAVIPKLNWSAPKDATWINQGSLKCETPGDVYLLLKSSDFILHDVLHALDDVVVTGDPVNETFANSMTTTSMTSKTTSGYPPLELVLRKWCNLHASMEFRCFVYGHQLVAVSQRHHTLHFPHLNDRREDILSLIEEFLHEVDMPSRFPLPNYVLDVYLDQQERIWILDFNVWGRQTDALLLEWDELTHMAITITEAHTAESDQEPNVAARDNNTPVVDFRIVETSMEVRHDPLASYRAPIDTIHLSSITGGDATKFQEFMAMCQTPDNKSSA